MPPQSDAKLDAGHAWEMAAPSMELPPREIHIWRAHLTEKNVRGADLWPILSEDEKRRASQFHLPEDSDAYVISHGMLRDALARYRAYVEEPLRICYGPKGQPYLLPFSGDLRLHFSLSHTRSLALLCVTQSRRVGVDVEDDSECGDWQSLVKRYFSSSEGQFLFALPKPEQKRAFLTLWTHKEAYLKARGEGLSGLSEPCTFQVSAGGTFHLKKGDGWSFLKLGLGDQCVGALAAEGVIGKVRFWDWSPLGAPAPRSLT